MKANPVGWFEIYVQDIVRAQKFYEAVFQGELSQLMADEQMTMLAFPMEMSLNGASGALVQMQGAPQVATAY